MNHSIKTGLAFGLTSGTITTMGLMVGLNSGTHSKLIVIGGIITIAVADAFSDALGIHISEESENVHTPAEIWTATISTFLAKFLCALSFLIPLLIFPLTTAVWISIAWGFTLLALFSYWLAREQKKPALPIITEHLAVTAIVIIITHLLGTWISSWSS